MINHFQILIIGGGNAGLSVASQLLLKNKKLDIGLIEPSEKHYYQPAWTLVGGGDFNIKNTEKNEADFIPNGVKWIKKSVESFRPEQNMITCQDTTSITYDILVVAPGIQLDWHKIKGAEEWLGKNGITTNYLFQHAPYTWECASEIVKGQKVIFTNPNTPIKCGGAPQKIMYLLSDRFKEKGLLNELKIHFYSGGGVIFGVKKYADTLNKVLERYGIITHFKHNCVEVDGENKIAYFENENGERVAQAFDMIHLTPPQSAPDFIKRSPLAILDSQSNTNPCLDSDSIPAGYLGWIDVNKHTLQHVRYSNIFACGDATNTPNAKTGAAIRKQVPVLVQNVLDVLNNRNPIHTYNGYGSCPLITGHGKLVLAEFDYDNQPMETFPIDQSKERWSMYQLKKYVLPWLYWNKILKGTA
jgi:sulfide:quinone oxidoreductase